MNIKSVKLNKNLKAHFFFPEFIDDVAIIQERKSCFSRIVDFPFAILRQLLVFIISIENLPEVSVIYKKTIVGFHNNRNENTISQVSDNMELNRLVRAQFSDYELSCRPMYGNQSGFFEKKGNKNSSCVLLTSITACRSTKKLIANVMSGKNDHWQRVLLQVKKRMRFITEGFNVAIYPDISTETALDSTGTIKEARRAGLLNILRWSLSKPTNTDTYVMCGLINLMWTEYNPYCLQYAFSLFNKMCRAHVIEGFLIS